MKVTRTVQFEDGDAAAVRGVVERCNMAANFFEPDSPGDKGGLQKVYALASGNPLTSEQLAEIRRAIWSAHKSVRAREPHALFQAETKKEYLASLLEAMAAVDAWGMATT